VPGAAASDLDRYNAATAHLEPPLAIVDLAALRQNAAAMVARAGGKPIRLQLVEGDRVTGTVPTYRSEGKSFG
jgi:hypothetical protein